MRDHTVTVFGGTGFLGRAVTRRLAHSGARVRIAARHPDARSFAGLEGRIERCPTDIRKERDVTAGLDGATAAVNVVSLYAEDHGHTFEDIHVAGATRIATAARDAGIDRLAHISGIGVDPDSPSRYIAARARGERGARQACPSTVGLRPSVLFGPQDQFLTTLDRLTRLPVIPLFGHGATRLQPVHVDDVAAAIEAALQQPAAQGRVFELGGADVHTWREIVRLVLRHRRRHRALVPVPFSAWHVMARMGRILPGPPLTRDQVILMEHDNVVGRHAATAADLGVEPRRLDTSLAACLDGS
jgi:NADH dehydrogenase